MMILPDLKLAFVHIYKTGGTSLTQLLAPYTGEKFRMANPRTSGDGFQGTWHYKNTQHSKFSHPKMGFPERLKSKLPDYRFLAVVRSPYTWSHSVYREFFADGRGGNKGPNFIFGQVKPNRTLEDFHAFADAFRPGHPDMMGLSTQHNFLDGIAPEQLKLIRFESYEQDVRRILPELGVAVDDLPHVLDRGDSKRADAEALMKNPAHVAFCNETYAVDFDNFGYEKISLPD